MFKIDKQKSIIQIVCFVIIFIAIVVFLYHVTYPSQFVVDGKVFSVEVSDTQALLEKGLSGHAPLSSNQGMLFIFQKPDNYGFWMKDMLFPIDIVWMDANWKIIHIEKSLNPDTYPKIFYPNGQAQYVLEISAGTADSSGLKIGDTAQYIGK